MQDHKAMLAALDLYISLTPMQVYLDGFSNKAMLCCRHGHAIMVIHDRTLTQAACAGNNLLTSQV